MARIESYDFDNYDEPEQKKKKKNKGKSIQSDSDDTKIVIKKRKKGKKALTALIVLLSLCVLTGVIYLLVQSLSDDVTETNTVYEGVSVNGQSLEGMTEEEVADYITKTFITPIESGSIEIKIADESLSYNLTDFVTYPDAKEIASEAYKIAREGSKRSRIEKIADLKTNPVDFDVSYKVQDGKLAEIVSKAYDLLFVVVENPTYSIMGDRVVFTQGTNGCNVNTEKLEQDLDAALETLKNQLANILETGKIELEPIVVETSVVEFSPINANEIYDKVYTDPEDAYFYRKNAKEIAINEDVDGITLDMDALNSAVDSVNAGEQFLYKEVLFSYFSADVTEADLSAILFRDVLGSELSTNIPQEGESSDDYDERNVNIQTCAEKLDGYVLMPGESYSIFSILGTVDEYNGFIYAYDNSRGADEKVMGGGISQVASALYVAALYSELDITNHTNSKYIVNFGLVGLDTYINPGTNSFSFNNNTEYPVKISVSYSNGLITAKIYGTEVRNADFTISSEVSQIIRYDTIRTEDPELYEGEERIIEGINGYVCKVYRTTEFNKVVMFTVSYEKKDKVIYYGTKKAEQPEEPVEDPTEEDPAEEDPTEEDPTEEDPTEEEPTEEDPTEEDPAEEDPAEEDPTEEDPAEEDPTEEDPTEEDPTEEDPTEEDPAEEDPAEEDPTEEDPTEEDPIEEDPTEEDPTEEDPTEEDPTEEDPTEEDPAEEDPTEDNPTEDNPTEDNPTEDNPTEEDPTEENKEEFHENPIKEFLDNMFGRKNKKNS